MKTLFVSFENYQELHELTIFVNTIKKDHPEWIFILFDTTLIYQLNEGAMQPYLDTYDLVIEGKNKFKKSFKTLSIFHKLYLTFVNTLKIFKIFKIYQVDMMLTGVPLVFFRYASFLRQNVFNLAYMRALIIGHDIDHSFSNKFDRQIKKIPLLRNIPIFDSWYCDALITVSDINSKYYLDRGMSREKIKISGSILLDTMKNSIKNKQATEKLELIFLTYAAAYHNNTEAQVEQLAVIRRIIKLQDEYKFDLIVRVHPRDIIDDYLIFIKDNPSVKIDTSPIDDFLKTCSKNRVVISAFSTLNFEWDFLGGKGYFYTTKNLDKTYGNFYKVLEIEPYYDIEKLIQNICNNIPQQYKKNIYKQHKDGTINYLKNLIYSEIQNA